jgi:hypothetical protein
MKNLKRFEAGSQPSKGESPQREGKKFIIREIVIKDVQVHVSLLAVGDTPIRHTVPINELRLTDVGTVGDNGVQVAELTGILVKAILTSVIERGGDILPKDISGELASALENLGSLEAIGVTLRDEAGSVLKGLGQGLGGLIGTEGTETGESGKGGLRNVVEGVGGLLTSKNDKK